VEIFKIFLSLGGVVLFMLCVIIYVKETDCHKLFRLINLKDE